MMRSLAATLTLLLLAWGLAQPANTASLGIRTETAQGGFLQVASKSLTFDLSPAVFPSRDATSYALPTDNASFDLVASGAPETQWVVRVRVVHPLVNDKGTDVIPSQSLEFRVHALDAGRPPGCVSTARGSWLTVGDGAPIIVTFDGGSTECRLAIFLRIKATGRELPGSYRGLLAWSIRRGR